VAKDTTRNELWNTRVSQNPCCTGASSRTITTKHLSRGYQFVQCLLQSYYHITGAEVICLSCVCSSRTITALEQRLTVCPVFTPVVLSHHWSRGYPFVLCLFQSYYHNTGTEVIRLSCVYSSRTITPLEQRLSVCPVFVAVVQSHHWSRGYSSPGLFTKECSQNLLYIFLSLRRR
jgi:uracil phosphoribosyltransferase